MRIYIPATTTSLRALLDAGEIPGPVTAFAVTPGLRAWYVDDDIEELEYVALREAARASLRMLDNDESAHRRRVVVAADVPDESVTVRDDLDYGVVRVTGDVPFTAIASAHVDDAEASDAVVAAAQAVTSADLGDEAAESIVDDADGFELSWYATQEIGPLLELM